MAAPMVSAAAALLLQKEPQLTPDQVKARLMKTAYKSFPAYSNATDPVTGTVYSSQYDILRLGAGYLDISAALDSSDVATETAMSPAAVYLGGPVSLNADASSSVGHVGGLGIFGGMGIFGIRQRHSEPLGKFGSLGQQHNPGIQRRISLRSFGRTPFRAEQVVNRVNLITQRGRTARQ